MFVSTFLLCLAGVSNVEATAVKMAASAQMATSLELASAAEMAASAHMNTATQMAAGAQTATASQSQSATEVKLEKSLTDRSMTKSPVRKVVRVLQDMQTKLEKEQGEDKKKYDEKICDCQTKGVKISREIAEFGEQIPALDSDIKGTTADKEKDKNEIDKDKQKFGLDQDDISKATSLNDKENEAYKEQKADLEQNIAALREAILALEKGVSSSFLQTPKAAVLRQMAKSSDLEDNERDALSSFLSQDNSYEPGSGEILGMLKQMKDEMIDDLGKLNHDNELRTAMYEALVAAKTKDALFQKSEIEKYMRRLAEDGILLAEQNGYRSDVYDALLNDKEYLARMEVRCNKFKEDYIKREKSRRAELLAISETVNILESDHARELFRKTVKSPDSSFVQLQRSALKATQKALQKLHTMRPKAGKGDTRLDLLAIDLQSGKISFDKVITRINELLGILKEEQKADDEKKGWCATELADAEGKINLNKLKVGTAEKAAASKKQFAEDLASELKTLLGQVKDGDAEYEKQTAERKKDHEEYISKLASYNAAKALLDMAVKRLTDYYAAVQVPHDTASSSFLQIPAPKGPIELLREIISDLAVDMQQLETSEKDAQDDYNQFVADEQERKDGRVNMITDKQGALAEAEKEEQEYADALATAQSEADTHKAYVKSMKAQCDFLNKYYDVRKAARKQEVSNLEDAKAVLSGADMSELIQTGHAVARFRGGNSK